MKTIILIAITILTTSAKAYNCANSKKSDFVQLSAAAHEIQDKAAEGDLRQEVDRSTGEFKQLNGIGIISVDGKKYDGSGFLVSPCHVLTNIHVVFDQQPAVKGKNVFFSVGQTGSATQPFLKTNVSGLVVAHGTSDDSISSDWVVIKLSKPVGNDVRYVPMYQMDSAQMVKHHVITAGFPADLATRDNNLSKMYGDLDCKVIGMNGFGHISHTCQTTGGQSGSPMVIKSPKDGKYYAIGMATAKHHGSSGLEKTADPNEATTAVNFESGKRYGVTSEGDMIVAAINANKCD